MHSAKYALLFAAIISATFAMTPASATIQEWTDNNTYSSPSTNNGVDGNAGNLILAAIPYGLLNKDPGITPDFATEIRRALAKIPQNILTALAANGYQIKLTEKLTDVVPGAKSQQVRGYQAHRTWDEVYGMFNRTTRQVVMAEKALTKDAVGRKTLGPLTNTRQRQGILRHECGHAVDQLLGNLSHSAAFKAAYEKGARTVKGQDRDVLNYYLQPGDAGREETFAELFACLEEHACDRHSDTLLRSYFPDLVALIKARIKDI